MPDYDLLIRAGTIVDGTGMPRYRGDVGIHNGRIAALGHIAGTAQRVIDAEGRIVAPGVVDLHSPAQLGPVCDQRGLEWRDNRYDWYVRFWFCPMSPRKS